MPWTPEEAREAASKGGKARAENLKRKSTMTPEQRAMEAIGAKTDKLVDELLNAALGEGDFEDLKKETRVAALIRCLEWRIGKPATTRPEAKPPEEEDQSGLSIG